MRIVGEDTRISGKVETLDLQGGVILLRHLDGRYTLVRASEVAIISVVPKRKDGNGNFLTN